MDLNVLEFTDYGKNYIKSRKLSPDSYFQMAIQLAFYRCVDIFDTISLVEVVSEFFV